MTRNTIGNHWPARVWRRWSPLTNERRGRAGAGRGGGGHFNYPDILILARTRTVTRARHQEG